jgi:phage repressor protein C with HTH and peptisase S24 domain
LVVYPNDKIADHKKMTREETRRENARKLADRCNSKAEFARMVQMEPSQVSQLIGPKPSKNIGNSIARRIEQAFQLPESWLDVEHVDKPRIDQVPPEADGTAIDDDGSYVSIKINGVRSNAVAEGDPSYNRVITEADDEQDVRIPLVELQLSAGVSGFEVAQSSESTVGHVRLDHRFVMNGRYDPSKLYALRVRGDSMESKLSDGDTVIIDTGDTKLVDGVIYAVNYEGEAVIKRLSRDAGDWWLTSDNPDQRKYHRKVCRGSGCIVVGRAIQAITSL